MSSHWFRFWESAKRKSVWGSVVSVEFSEVVGSIRNPGWSELRIWMELSYLDINRVYFIFSNDIQQSRISIFKQTDLFDTTVERLVDKF